MNEPGCQTSLLIKSNQGKPFLRHPVGQNRDDFIRLGGVIGLQVEGKIVRAAHPFVHHKDR
jgi:hypothetical protein